MRAKHERRLSLQGSFRWRYRPLRLHQMSPRRGEVESHAFAFEPSSRIELEPPVYPKPKHGLRASRAGANELAINGTPSLIANHQRRADDGDRTRLNQLGKLTPHQAASSAEHPSRVSTFGAEAPDASSLPRRSHMIAGPGSRMPVHLVEVRGVEPPIPCAQGTCDTASLHLEKSASLGSQLFPGMGSSAPAVSKCRARCRLHREALTTHACPRLDLNQHPCG